MGTIKAISIKSCFYSIDKWRIERIQKNGSCLSISRYGRRRMGPLEKFKRPVEGVMSSKIFSGIRQQKDTGGKITWPSVSSAGECESTRRQTLAIFFFPPENEG